VSWWGSVMIQWVQAGEHPFSSLPSGDGGYTGRAGQTTSHHHGDTPTRPEKGPPVF
jgi:hypothetical protein